MILTTAEFFVEHIKDYIKQAEKGEEIEIMLDPNRSLILKSESSIQELKDIKTELYEKNSQLKFLEQGWELTEKYNISRDIACCFICNFEDDYICNRFNGGCKNHKLCKEIHFKQLEESAFKW